jgi:alpha-D-ribose 1-methylphosphonate 5-phosphate C-P lyase
VSLDFEDVPFRKEDFTGKFCRDSGADNVFLDELIDEETGETYYLCNDSAYRLERMNKQEALTK